MSETVSEKSHIRIGALETAGCGVWSRPLPPGLRIRGAARLELAELRVGDDARPRRHGLAHAVRAVRVTDRVDRVRARQDRRRQVWTSVLVRRGRHVEGVVVLVEEVPEPPALQHLDL